MVLQIIFCILNTEHHTSVHETRQPDLGESGVGQMKTGKPSIWKRVGFKFWGFLFTAQTSFTTFRTLPYATGGGVDGEDAELDSD